VGTGPLAGGWGFAPASDSVTLSPCDSTTSQDGNLRLCWNLEQTCYFGICGSKMLVQGFRCGDNSPNWLNSSAAWERLVYQAD
jgi:hypothetical protein